MTNADVVFRAIAHPARRKILALLSENSCSVKTLTRTFAMSQPAISQHLHELKEAELVTSERVGQEQRYRLTGEPLRAVYEWSAEYKRFFDPAGHACEFAPAREHPGPNESERKRSNGG